MVKLHPTVYLFDIDGTLIDGAGSGRRAMEAGFAEVTGIPDVLREIRFAGMTDPAIVRAGLRAAGREPGDDDALIDEVIEAYLARLPLEIAATPGFRLHAGVVAVLAALATRPSATIGLGTGNVERGARLKLEPLGVADDFAFGGFASDHEDRPTLIGIGAQRGCARLGCARGDARIVVIGDTPKDVDAARAIGAQCLAVATSFFSVDELRAAGATLAVDALSEPAALEYLWG